ncbi:hypothetical protein D9M71_428950 [compost metagenome]
MEAADGGQAQVGVEAQDPLGDGAEARGLPAQQAPGQQQGGPADAEAEEDRQRQSRQRRVVQWRGGQAAEEQGGEQDEVVEALGGGPEGLAGKVPAAQQVAADDQGEERPEGFEKGQHGDIRVGRE